jgi:hypothetical protein
MIFVWLTDNEDAHARLHVTTAPCNVRASAEMLVIRYAKEFFRARVARTESGRAQELRSLCELSPNL